MTGSSELRCWTEGPLDARIAVPFRAIAAAFWRVTGLGPHFLARVFSLALVGVVTIQAFVIGMSLANLTLGVLVTVAICVDMIYALPRYEAAFSNIGGTDRLPAEALLLLNRVARRRPFWAAILTLNAVWQAIGGGPDVISLTVCNGLFAVLAVGQDYFRTCSFPPGRTIRERLGDLLWTPQPQPAIVRTER